MDHPNRVVKPRPLTVRVNPKDGLEYVWLPQGEFLMGATPGDAEAAPDEKPQHRVRLTKGFWLGQTPVTRAAYTRFATETARASGRPTSTDKADHPVADVTWDDANAYCAWAGGRLPSEAEWEYAARGGKENLKYASGEEIRPAHEEFGQEIGTRPVKSYPPQNGWGLYDVSANVIHWLADWYGERYYETFRKPAKDPTGPPQGTLRVIRGSSWNLWPRDFRASYRYKLGPGVRFDLLGFRCVCDTL